MPLLSLIARSLGVCRAVVWLAALVAVGAALWLVRPRPNPLVWYTTPPLDKYGTEVRLLIPQGWQQLGWGPTSLLIGPKSRYPNWLQRIGIGRTERASIDLTWWPDEPTRNLVLVERGESVHVLVDGNRRKQGWFSLAVIGGPGNSCLQLDYARSDKQAFDATHQSVYRSVRMLTVGKGGR